MDKLDITHSRLCIKRIISVVKGENLYQHKLMTVKGRHSDAFVYILAGSCIYRFDDGIEFTASAGDVLYLPFHSVYTMYVLDPAYRFIFCDFEFAEQEAKQGALYHFELTEPVHAHFSRLLNLYRSSASDTHTECMALLYLIYSASQKSVRPPHGKKTSVTEAKNYIDAHFNAPDLAISALAEKCGISEVYFRRLFQENYGLSPSRYLISVRLQKAKDLMKYPFLTLEDCALQSGFSSLQYFCRTFKKETGISPGKYRSTL